MKKNYIIFLLVAGLCFSCKNKENIEKPMNTIGSSLITHETVSQIEFTELSVENYELEALQILENGKKRLQIALPLTIDRQVNLYKETLQKFSEQAVSSLSLEETQNGLIEVESEMALEMMEDELELNKIYYELVYELEEVNKKYATFIDPKREKAFLLDYHNSPSIVYSQDILIKITEFVRSDEAFKGGKNKGELLSALNFIASGISMIPHVAASIVSGTIKLTTMGGTALNELEMEKKAGAPIPTTISRLRSALDNPVEREKLKNDLKSKLRLTMEENSGSPMSGNLSAAAYESARREFSGFGSRLKGRIGDFSDGIITQPIGHLRNMIENNVEILSEQVDSEKKLAL